MSTLTKILLGVLALGIAIAVIVIVKRKKAAVIPRSIGPAVQTRSGRGAF